MTEYGDTHTLCHIYFYWVYYSTSRDHGCHATHAQHCLSCPRRLPLVSLYMHVVETIYWQLGHVYPKSEQLRSHYMGWYPYVAMHDTRTYPGS